MGRTRKAATTAYQWDRTARRVHSLGGGTAVRIFDHHGLAWVTRAGDLDAGRNLARLLADITAADPDCAARIIAELPDEWRARLNAAGGLPDDELAP